jgi:hypothetical protein
VPIAGVLVPGGFHFEDQLHFVADHFFPTVHAEVLAAEPGGGGKARGALESERVARELVELHVQGDRLRHAMQAELAGDLGLVAALCVFHFRGNEMRFREFLRVEERAVEDLALPLLVAELQRGDRDAHVDARRAPVGRIEVEHAADLGEGADRRGEAGVADLEGDAGRHRVEGETLRARGAGGGERQREHPG